MKRQDRPPSDDGGQPRGSAKNPRHILYERRADAAWRCAELALTAERLFNLEDYLGEVHGHRDLYGFDLGLIACDLRDLRDVLEAMDSGELVFRDEVAS